MGGRRIDQHAAGQHDVAEFADPFFVLGIGVKHRRMAQTAVFQQSLGIIDGFFIGIGLVKGQRGRKFFSGERHFRTDALDFGDQHLGGGGNFDTGKFGNGKSRLADDLGIELAVHLNHIGNGLGFFGIEDVAAAFGKFFFDSIVNTAHHRDRLFGSTDHAVIERLGKENAVDSHFHIAGIIKHHRRIAGAHAHSRSAAGIGGLHHAGTASGKDQSHVFVPHQVTAHSHSGFIDPGDDVLGSTGLNSGIQHDLGGKAGAFFGARMGAENNTIPGLEGDQSLENGSGGGVGSGNDPGDHAAGFGNLDHTGGIIGFDDPAGFQRQIFIADIFGGIMILDDLVFHHAHAGFFHGHLGQRNPHIVGGQSGSLENPVNLFLGEIGKFLLGGTDFGNQHIDHCFFLCLLHFGGNFRGGFDFLTHLKLL